MNRTSRTLAIGTATAALLAGTITTATPANALPAVGSNSYTDFWDGKDAGRMTWKVTGKEWIYVQQARIEPNNDDADLDNVKIRVGSRWIAKGDENPGQWFPVNRSCKVPCTLDMYAYIDPFIGAGVVFNPAAKIVK